MAGNLVDRWMAIRSVPSHVIVLAAAASYAGLALAALQGWPMWAIVLAALLPWIPVFASEMVWTYHNYGWLALLYVLVATQTGHFIEHVVQIVQIHMLGMRGADASGVFGALDVEWVHFVWNTWVLIAVVLLLTRFRQNPWLWAMLVVAGWHELEHAYIMSVYLSTGAERTPGLLSRGGAIGGGLPFTRPDLHFGYNLIETVPMLLAFVYQLRNAYNRWVAQAFPSLSEHALIETTNQLEVMTIPAGEVIIRQGDTSDRFYIITDGQVEVTRRDEEGREHALATLGPGQFFGEIGLLANTPRTATVKAKSEVHLLSLDRQEFRQVMDSSSATAEEFARVVKQRLAALST